MSLRTSAFRKILMSFMLLLIAAAWIAWGIWHFRYDIARFTANVYLRLNIPENVTIERVVVNTSWKSLDLFGVRVGNPPGFSDPVLFRAGSVKLNYSMRGKNILSGFDITGIEFNDPEFRVERLSDGTTNFNEIYLAPPGGSVSRLPVLEIKKPEGRVETGTSKNFIKKVSEAVDFKGLIPGKINKGKVFFKDNMVYGKPFEVSLESVDSELAFSLNRERELIYIETTGGGVVFGELSQTLKWRISADLSSGEMTLSTRIEPGNVDIVPFRVYYDEYSPVDIFSGRVSGTIIFDLHNGNIGSDNLLRFRGLDFSEKTGTGALRFWGSGIRDVAKYLELSSGETIFDFKIKGPVENPRFYPGPNVSRAMQNMAIDKIGGLFRSGGQSGETTSVNPASASDTENVLDIFREFMR